MNKTEFKGGRKATDRGADSLKTRYFLALQGARPLEPGGGAELEGEGTALSVAGAQGESRGGVVSCRGVCTQSGS